MGDVSFDKEDDSYSDHEGRSKRRMSNQKSEYILWDSFQKMAMKTPCARNTSSNINNSLQQNSSTTEGELLRILLKGIEG